MLITRLIGVLVSFGNEEGTRMGKGANFRCIFPANGNYINRNSGAYEGCCHGDDEYFGTPPSFPPRDPKIRIPSFNREYKFYVCTPREISNISTVCPKNEM